MTVKRVTHIGLLLFKKYRYETSLSSICKLQTNYFLAGGTSHDLNGDHYFSEHPRFVFDLDACFATRKRRFLIAGYNTMGAEEKAKYDTVALCKATGKIMAGVTFTLVLQFSGELFQLKWLSIGSIILMFVILIGAIRYMYTGNRFLIRTK